MKSSARFAGLCLAASVALSFSVLEGAGAASADPIAVPSLVDDGAYPGAAQILAEQNVGLIGGDGHILLADCATPPSGDIGLMKVYTTDETIGADGIGRVCFKVTAAAGWLTLQVPGVYEIRGDGQRTGTGHEVTAELHSDAGEDLTVAVQPDGSTPVGLGADPNASPTMLLQLTAGTGRAPVTGGQPAVGKVFAHDDRMCSATLVAPQWILSAAGCFADNPLQPVIAEGAPLATAAVVFPGHASMAIDWVSPYAGRDVVLARLAGPVSDITPIMVATAIAPTGTALAATGYGRTATNWINDQQQTAQITFTATDATTLSATSGPLVCKGMAGAPVLSGGKLAAVLSQAGQTGCFDTAGSGSSVTAARTDDLTTWFTGITTPPRCDAALTQAAGGPGLGSATGAASASSVGDEIPRSEMLARAQYWVDRGYVYSPDAPASYTSSPDATGRLYRDDCFGFVSNAWQLSTSYTPDEFIAKLDTSGYWHTIRVDDLKAGDAVLKVVGHIELFAKWKSQSDHTQGAYVYSFNSAGETVQNPYTSSNLGNLGFNSWSDMNSYTPIRYDNVTEDVPNGGGATAVMGDLGLLSTPAKVIAMHRKGSDNGVWGVSQVSEGGGYSPWIKIGSQTTASYPATLTATDGRIVVFVRGTDNKIYGVSQLAAGGAYGAWGQIGTGQPTFTGDPTAVLASNGAIVVYATGTDGKVWGVSQSAPGSAYGAWIQIGSSQPAIASSPAILRSSSGLLVAIARGTDNKIYGVSQNSVGGAYGAWGQIGTGQTTFVGDPSVALAANGSIVIYATAGDGRLWAVSQLAPGRAYGTWSSIGSATSLNSNASVLRASTGALAAFARAADGKVYGISQVAVGAAYGDWRQIGTGQPTFTGDVSAFVAPNGGITIAGKATDGWVWGVSQAGPTGAYGAWIHIGS